MDDKCLFCNETQVLHTHHIVPRRHEGSDKEENLVTVCPNCHSKLENLYDDRFYSKIQEQMAPEVFECPYPRCRDEFTVKSEYKQHVKECFASRKRLFGSG